MSITLYKAADDVAALLDLIDEDGVIPDALAQALSTFEGKSVSVAAYALNCEAAASMCKTAIDQMTKRMKAYQKRAEWSRQYLADNMRKTGTTEIVADDKTFSAKLYIERDSSVDVFQPELVPELYMREIPAKFEPDKRLIKKALDDGHDVPGCVIRKKDRLEIK